MQFQEVIEVESKPRTDDVKSTGSFESLMISPTTIENMSKFGFKYPSPVQEKAIPAGLAGLDLLVQAKSGTGKTLVFSVMAAENLNTQVNCPQRMLLAPTREIAIQISETIRRVAHHRAKIAVLVGGTPLSLDIRTLKKGVHVVVGTTGRISQLVSEKYLTLSNIDLFVLDEADKLMEESFQKDINYLFSCLPPSRQVAVFSATYPRGLDTTLAKFMRDVTLIRLNSEDVQLIGIKQYVSIVCDLSVNEALTKLLTSVTFNQALVFCNSHQDCASVSAHLDEGGFETAYISAQMSQPERDKTIELLKRRKIKVLVSTDLTARGIDAENVNLVVNMGAATDIETYFHRIGRAARFGGLGAAVTLLTDRTVGFFSAMVRSSVGDVHVRLLQLEHVVTDLTTNSAHHKAAKPFTIVKKSSKERNFDEQSSHQLSNGSMRLRDLDSVKKSEYVMQGLWRYTRSDMLALREFAQRPAATLMQTIFDLELGSSPSYSKDIEQFALERKLVKSKEREEIIPTEESKLVNDEPPKKFKFVPSRAKNKKNIYLRGELMSIKNSFDAETWLAYAMSKYDLRSEPFCDENNIFENECDSVKTEQEPICLEVDRLEKTVLPSPIPHTSVKPQVLKYSRKQMIAVTTQVSKDRWLSYVRNKWNTHEEPWQLDPYLRCSFEEQLRRIRQREKLQRAQVLAARQQAITQSPLVVASSRSILRPTMNESSFEEYCCKLAEAYSTFHEPSVHIGAVVPQRDNKEIWGQRVAFYSNYLSRSDAQFRYDVAKKAGICKETVTDMEFEPCGASTLRESKTELLDEGSTSHIDRCELSSLEMVNEPNIPTTSISTLPGPTCVKGLCVIPPSSCEEEHMDFNMVSDDSPILVRHTSSPRGPPLQDECDLTEIDEHHVNFSVAFSAYLNLMNGQRSSWK